jgi:HAAS
MDDPETLVAGYLGELEDAAAELPPEQRAELIGDVRGHIDLALAEAGALDEATVRTVLARLGSPEEIGAAAADSWVYQPVGPVPSAGPVVRRPRRLTVEARALLLLTVGAVVMPFVGPLLGLWIAAGSTRWTLLQKRTAAMIVLVVLAVPALVLLPMAAAGELTWVVTSGGFMLPFVPLGGWIAAAYLVASTSIQISVQRRT